MEISRKEALEKMSDIEQKFVKLKEDYFAQKVESVRNEMNLVENGKHEKYQAKDQLLVEKHQRSLEAAARERTYQIRSAQLVYEAEVAQAEKELQTDRKHLKKKMLEALQSRVEELEEEKKDLSVAEFNERKAAEEVMAVQPKKKKAKPEAAPVVTGPDGRRRRLNPPHVNYSIRDAEIYSDMHLLRKPLPRAQLENILYDVYASSNDALIYYDKRFEVGQGVIVADREGKQIYHGNVTVVSPVEVKIQVGGNAGASTQSIELSKLREGELTLLKP